MKHKFVRILKSIVGLAFAAVIAIQGSVPTLAAAVPGTASQATLPAGGGWAAYSVTYPGEQYQLGIALTYSPADAYTEIENAITLELYSSASPPPGGIPIATATWEEFGKRYLDFTSDTAGAYIVVIHNWDPLGREITVNLATMNADTLTPEAALTFVSKSEGATVTSPEPAPAVSASEAVLAETSEVAQAATTVSAALAANGGWSAYTFYYPGDNSKIGIGLTYEPADEFNDAENAMTVEVYSPENPPPAGTPVGSASWSVYGERYLEFSSDVAGTYTVVVNNWDLLGRSVKINLTSTNEETEGPGPGLVFLSSGQ